MTATSCSISIVVEISSKLNITKNPYWWTLRLTTSAPQGVESLDGPFPTDKPHAAISAVSSHEKRPKIRTSTHSSSMKNNQTFQTFDYETLPLSLINKSCLSDSNHLNREYRKGPQSQDPLV